MLLTLKARYFAQLLAVVVLVGASPVDAQLSAVLAEDQGIAVTISNYTPYTLTDESDEYAKTNSGDIIGPGFPPTVLPYQHTGTSIFLRGGIASGATATMSYFFNQFNDAGVGTELIFNLNFVADTDWDFKAAASDVLHAVKKKVSSDAQDSFKNAEEESTEDALELAGAEDGMTEVMDTMDVIEDIAKLFGALDPSFVMKFGWEASGAGGLGVFYDGESCISENTDSPASANVVILGPDQTPTADTTDQFYVLSALSVNAQNPGFVDASITPMCAYVCAAFNASNDWLNSYTNPECTSMFEQVAAGNTLQQDAFNGYSELNACISNAADGPAGVAWVTPPTSASQRWGPANVSGGAGCAQTTFTYPDVTDSICGTCPVVKVDTVPDAPTIDSITAGNSNGAVVITVTPGADNGAAITDYTATCTDGSADYTGTSATTTITVGGLTNGVAYTCTVISTNAVGTSPTSAVSSVVYFDPPAPTIDPPGEWQNFCNLDNGSYSYNSFEVSPGVFIPELCAQCVSSDFVGIPDWNETPSVKSCAYCQGNVDVDVQGNLVCDGP